MMLLFELALRHLFGGRFSVYLRYRWRRWLTALLSLAAAIILAVVIAFRGSPVWGAVTLFGGLAVLFLLRRLIHAPIPEAALGAYASAVSLIAVLGIALAVMTLIVVISVMDGFTFDIQRALLRTTPHVKVTSFDERLDPAATAMIRRIDGVVRAEPFVENEVLLKLEGYHRPIPILLRGEGSADRGEDGPQLIKGEWDVLGHPGKIILGEELARSYYLDLGDRIRVITSGGTLDDMAPPRLAELEVAGMFRTGFYEVDQGMAIMGIDAARELLDMGDLISGVAVTGEDLFSAQQLARRISGSLPFPAVSLSWAELRRNMYEAMRTEKYAMFIIELFLILIASFNITSTLFMAVGRKTREIAVLMSMGLSRRSIVALFSLEGFMIGCVGTVLGVAVGAGFSLYLKYFPIHMPGGGSVYYIDTIPVYVSPGLIVATAGASMLLSLLASVYPAWRASRLSPSRALRFE